MLTHIKIVPLFSALVAASIVAACSGGSTGGGGGGGGGGGATPTPAATAALNGTMQIATSGTNPGNAGYAPAAGDQVVFSCGCTSQAGTTNASGTGAFTLVQNSPATPAAPNPTYTIVPGRNYVIIAQGPGSQAWAIQFAGKVPSHNLYLNGSTPSDAYTAAVSLYVFENSTNGSATAFDDWNFFNLQAWYGVLKTSPNAAETKLLNDIVTQSVAAQPLFPSHPGWNSSQPTNATILADLNSVKTSGDPAIPTPCPVDGSGNALCTGAPSP